VPEGALVFITDRCKEENGALVAEIKWLLNAQSPTKWMPEAILAAAKGELKNA
jgi:hypothetical protein